ncbi:hypothetical protein MGMO_77c00330 [Methyloglobulus morosus KoM1]|uniref:DUF721 domain-containing protein n=1 Tax=Methyloglobulus morosus KoM1 TaxID=1116472 RepID=V5BFG4_9GAMM|nr:DciA family protein [Methyloglobulus morosus]ESS72020.1 hypothetical protein MGMO_77c00330 [Methyloglobulus morosus KoM1]
MIRTNTIPQRPQPLKPILSFPNRTIAQLCLQINQQLAVLGRIRAALPKELAIHALHCVCNNKKLIIYTDSANWASQLRFYGETILAAFESTAAKPVTLLQIKIIDGLVPEKTSPKNKALIPNENVAYEIRRLSLRTTDTELSQALDKLSKTLIRIQP